MEDIDTLFNFLNVPGGISPIEKLLSKFEAHETKEGEALDRYRQLLDQINHPAARVLIQLIIADEEKHRAATHSMAATLRGSLTWTKPKDSLESNHTTGVIEELRRVTNELVRLEKDGIKEYQALVKESTGYYHGLFRVLLDSIIRDSEKHVKLLEFVSQTLNV